MPRVSSEREVVQRFALVVFLKHLCYSCSEPSIIEVKVYYTKYIYVHYFYLLNRCWDSLGLVGA